MATHFNKETARKDLSFRRPLNVEYLPEVGQDWEYFDAENEGRTLWAIETIEDDFCCLVKKSGRDIGFRAGSYEIEKLTGRRWKPQEESATARYLWPCPTCGEDEPVYPGDYMCKVCRNSLDKS